MSVQPSRTYSDPYAIASRDRVPLSQKTSFELASSQAQAQPKSPTWERFSYILIELEKQAVIDMVNYEPFHLVISSTTTLTDLIKKITENEKIKEFIQGCNFTDCKAVYTRCPPWKHNPTVEVGITKIPRVLAYAPHLQVPLFHYLNNVPVDLTTTHAYSSDRYVHTTQKHTINHDQLTLSFYQRGKFYHEDSDPLFIQFQRTNSTSSPFDINENKENVPQTNQNVRPRLPEDSEILKFQQDLASEFLASQSNSQAHIATPIPRTPRTPEDISQFSEASDSTPPNILAETPPASDAEINEDNLPITPQSVPLSPEFDEFSEEAYADAPSEDDASAAASMQVMPKVLQPQAMTINPQAKIIGFTPARSYSSPIYRRGG